MHNLFHLAPTVYSGVPSGVPSGVYPLGCPLGYPGELASVCAHISTTHIHDPSQVCMHNTFKTGNAKQEVLRLGPTMYFGELALLRGEPRAATVAALSDTSLLMLARQDFNQLLGPLQTLLGQHATLYGPTQPTDAKQVGKPSPPTPMGDFSSLLFAGTHATFSLAELLFIMSAVAFVTTRFLCTPRCLVPHKQLMPDRSAPYAKPPMQPPMHDKLLGSHRLHLSLPVRKTIAAILG